MFYPCLMFLIHSRQNLIKSVRYLSKMSASSTCKIAVCQLTASNNKVNNLKIVQKLVNDAVQGNAQMVFLPEGCDYVANNKEEINAMAETLDGVLMTEYKKLAQTYRIWLSIGGFHEVIKINDTKKYHNAHVLLNDQGEVCAVYRKLHLFDVQIPEKNIDLKESDYVTAGNKIIPPVSTPAGPLALAICYDIRFPELSTTLRKLGANVLTFPSAFTSKTGQAHWEILLRARAIENQCYVVAAAQYGCHNTTRTSFGQSMIVDPWGKIIAECPKYTEEMPSNESIAIAEINANSIFHIRQEMPVFQHRRNDIYSLITNNFNLRKIDGPYMFGEKNIPPSTVFYTSQHSFAFTNIRCVVPGHALISTLRPVSRLTDLTLEEVNDFFQTTINVQKVLENVQSTTSSTICIQDGKDAGQTIAHVHCHILPRKPGDFQRNDDIYVELSKHDRDNNEQPIRSLEEMSKEADILRAHFK